jgi:hypothetical protein
VLAKASSWKGDNSLLHIKFNRFGLGQSQYWTNFNMTITALSVTMPWYATLQPPSYSFIFCWPIHFQIFKLIFKIYYVESA